MNIGETLISDPFSIRSETQEPVWPQNPLNRTDEIAESVPKTAMCDGAGPVK